MNLIDRRPQYGLHNLSRHQLHEEPITQLKQWLADALELDDLYAHAMSVATVGRDNQPSSRMVLLKELNQEGLSFYTNLQSRKALDIQANSKVALLFHWFAQERQVRIEGLAEPLPTAKVTTYFNSRPRESQISAHASQQSRPLDNRASLLEQVRLLEKQFQGKEVPPPEYWGGYLVKPHRIEFWQGRSNRLHDRFCYSLCAQGWTIERLSP